MREKLIEMETEKGLCREIERGKYDRRRDGETEIERMGLFHRPLIEQTSRGN